jgi:hypothetical protein
MQIHPRFHVSRSEKTENQETNEAIQVTEEESMSKKSSISESEKESQNISVDGLDAIFSDSFSNSLIDDFFRHRILPLSLGCLRLSLIFSNLDTWNTGFICMLLGNRNL